MADDRYERVLRLKNGAQVQVRPIRGEDEDLLQDAFSRMSERSVYFRFFSPLKRLPDAMAQRLSHVDHSDRFALVATTPWGDAGRSERIMGVARYDRAAGTDVAEVAVAVVDEMQRQGLGAGLLALLAQAGRDHGSRPFR